MDKKYSSKDLTKDILLIAAVSLVIPTVLLAPGLALALKPFFKNKTYHPSRIKKRLESLQKQKLISISEGKDTTKIELLEGGHKKVLSFKIEELKLKRTKKWDGKWRVVVFDIPEKNRTARDFLRLKLREIGLYQLQKSVLVTPWECKEIVDFVKHYYDVGEYVNTFLATKLDEDLKVKKYFNL